MNNDRKIFKLLSLAAFLLAGISLAPGAFAQAKKPFPTAGSFPHANRSSLAPNTSAQNKKSASGEEFFIIASVDQSKSQILLKHPTEVTLLAKVDANTKYADDAGKPLKLSDFRTGDTVWVTLSGGSTGTTAMRIHKGQMTVADLHRYYLDYPEIK